jgi:hypothetical protein
MIISSRRPAAAGDGLLGVQFLRHPANRTPSGAPGPRPPGVSVPSHALLDPADEGLDDLWKVLLPLPERRLMGLESVPGVRL